MLLDHVYGPCIRRPSLKIFKVLVEMYILYVYLINVANRIFNKKLKHMRNHIVFLVGNVKIYFCEFPYT